MPLWVTLVLAIGGGYVIAPFINQEVQRESLRREFLVSSLQALSTDTISLIGAVNNAVIEVVTPEEIRRIDEQIVAIQYKLVQLNIAIPARRPDAIDLQSSLSELQGSLRKYSPANSADLAQSLADFSSQSFELYEELVGSAGLL